jgi:Zn ribbon nucleic-acid-binding protein
MSRFIGHHPCPRCGSRDNLAEYEDHFWCFGCRYRKIKSDIHTIKKRINKVQEVHKPIADMETTAELPIVAKQWLYKYSITPEEIVKHNFQWNPTINMLVLYKDDRYWQGRMFNNTKQKYLSYGSKPVLTFGEGRKVVVVEDILSAIKVARLTSSACLLGSSLSREMLFHLQQNYDNIIIWLDRDKATTAMKISKQFIQLGKQSGVVISTKDPKEYSTEELKNWLNYKL